MALTIDSILSQLNTSNLADALSTVLSAAHTEECNPRTTVQGGARLHLLTQENPQQGFDLGLVLFTPNVPRPFHTEFNPDSPDLNKFTDDWFDKLVYISHDNYNSQFKAFFDVMSTSSVFMRATMDHADACGCSCSCPCVSIKRLVLTLQDGKLQFNYEDHGRMYVLAANFVPDGDPTQTAPMTAQDFFVAAGSDKELIFNHPQHAVSMAKSQASRPLDCDGRRSRVARQVKRLRQAQAMAVFSHPPSVF
jgi:hypothetical protein